MSIQHEEAVTVKGIELLVKFDYCRAHKGARDSLGGVRGAGPPLEPDEPESIEINEVFYNGCNIWEIVDAWGMYDEIEEAIWQLQRDYEDDRADFLYEQEKDRRMGL